MVIEHDLVDVEVCRRKDHWKSEHYYLGDEVFFASIDFRLPIAEIYERVVNEDMHDYLQSLLEKNNFNGMVFFGNILYECSFRFSFDCWFCII